MSKIKNMLKKIPPFHIFFRAIEGNKKEIKKLGEELKRLKEENTELQKNLMDVREQTKHLENIFKKEQKKSERLEIYSKNKIDILQREYEELHELSDRRNQNMHDFVVNMHRDSCEKIAENRNEFYGFRDSVKNKHASTDLQIKAMKGRMEENCAYILMEWNELHKEQYALYEGKKREHRIIVSLTSYGERLKKVHHTIQSLLLQTVKPDKIILYLEAACQGQITEELEKLKAYGLEIVIGIEDLKPHKKYYYAIQEYPNDIVITVDDDLIYEEELIELLMESYEKYPNAVSAKRVHRMKKDAHGNILPYSRWQNECRELSEPSMELLATNGAGTLFPPKCLGTQYRDKDTFMKMAPCQDDIWLKFVELKAGIPVVYVPGKYVLPPVVPETQQQALYYKNNAGNANDECIQLLQEELQIKLGEYCSLEETL
ncbi:MAG: glycosyltransferase [Lachnospiraceae bacterium]|nr:glycosyltransferase [Lachnospiraceae bacterium]